MHEQVLISVWNTSAGWEVDSIFEHTEGPLADCCDA
jgi:hypothetical protein